MVTYGYLYRIGLEYLWVHLNNRWFNEHRLIKYMSSATGTQLTGTDAYLWKICVSSSLIEYADDVCDHVFQINCIRFKNYNNKHIAKKNYKSIEFFCYLHIISDAFKCCRNFRRFSSFPECLCDISFLKILWSLLKSFEVFGSLLKIFENFEVSAVEVFWSLLKSWN